MSVFGKVIIHDGTDDAQVDGGGNLNVTGSTSVVNTVAVTGTTVAIGDIADGAADSGPPVKSGSKATDYEPSTSGEYSGGITAVDENDRVNDSANLYGEKVEGVNTFFQYLTNLDNTYDDSPTSATSSTINCWNYRWCTFGFGLSSVSAPTTMRFQIQVSPDGTNWMDLTNGPLNSWIYEDTYVATQKNEAYTFPVCARHMRVEAFAVGTTASKTFTVTGSYIQLRN
jgi:hypothetical protein